METQQLKDLGLPVIVLGGSLPDLPSMAIDDRAVTQLATEHLVALGHRHIGYIGGEAAFDVDYHVPSRRREGFLSGLRQHGITPDESLVREADFTIAGGYAAAKQLYGSPANQMTALVAASDEMAIGALLAARDLGIAVPQQMSVVGIDGHELGGLFQLTTVDQQPASQGRTAAEHMLRRVESDEEFTIDLPYTLLVRGSTAAPTHSVPSSD